MYILTSNTDGRGIPTSNDDRILKITSVSTTLKIKGDASLPPLQQIKQGILFENVLCKSNLQLLLKPVSGMPVCVTEKTAEELITRGWK